MFHNRLLVCHAAHTNTTNFTHTQTHIHTHKLIHNRAHTLGYYGIVCVSLCSFFSVFSRCCRPWLHCCELCAHLSYGFIICCSLFNTRDFGRREKKNAMFSFINTHNQALYLFSLSLAFFFKLCISQTEKTSERQRIRPARTRKCASTLKIIPDVDFHYTIYFVLSVLAGLRHWSRLWTRVL